MRLSTKLTLFSVLNFLLTVLWLFGMTACASLLPKHQTSIEVTQDVSVTSGDATPRKLSKGEKLQIEDSPVLVESQGFVGVLVVPLDSATSVSAKLSLKSMEQWETDSWRARQNQEFNSLLAGVNEVQVNLANRHPYDALSKIDELIAAHPKIVPLKFLKASCLVAVGKQPQAKILLEQGLKEMPEDKNARRMLDILSRQHSGHSASPETEDQEETTP